MYVYTNQFQYCKQNLSRIADGSPQSDLSGNPCAYTGANHVTGERPSPKADMETFFKLLKFAQ